MRVEYIAHTGSDLMVVDAARVSFDKQTTEDELTEKDIKLIKYLADHDHWSPFAHPQITMRVTAPIFVARQLAKHQVGFSWNEVSRRYVDTTPEFFIPNKEDGWRKRADNIKQGSSNHYLYHLNGLYPDKVNIHDQVDKLNKQSLHLYRRLIKSGVCPEQARMILPLSTYTEWIWTGSLLGFARVCQLRLESHSQEETREIAMMIEDIVEPLFPISWEELLAWEN